MNVSAELEAPVARAPGYQAEVLTFDHIVPRSRGGRTVWDNVVTACEPCNLKKGHRSLKQAGMRLRKDPHEPRPNPYSFLKVASLKETWLPFVPWLVPESNPSGSFASAGAAGD